MAPAIFRISNDAPIFDLGALISIALYIESAPSIVSVIQKLKVIAPIMFERLGYR